MPFMHPPSQLLPEQFLKKFANGSRLKLSGYRGRFAPSPTGPLHFGNLRTALLSWLKARVSKGTWLLRIDDLDYSRNRFGASEGIKEDLLWLGLEWDGPVVYQSKRRGLYYTVLSALRKEGLLYACRCSRRMFLERAIREHQSGIANCRCREITNSWGWQNNRLPSWCLMPKNEVTSNCRGVVLRRADGIVAYHLATVIDEILLGINEVVRGGDLLEACSSQLSVFEVLSQPRIKYIYTPLICNEAGEKLSKRNNENGLDYYKKKGLDPSQVIGLLAESIKLVPPNTPISSNELLVEMKKDPAILDAVFIH